MTTAQIIKELRCDNARRRLQVAEAAAEALELLEERIAIISERLTAQEWEEQQNEARARILLQQRRGELPAIGRNEASSASGK